jgi:hypothetical protein
MTNYLHDPRVATLRALGPGAAAQVLLAFLMFPDRSLGNQDLQTLTGKTDKTITNALRALGPPPNGLGLIQCHARYSGWMLTAVARQLLLGETDPVSERSLGEPENFRLPVCSSSSYSSARPGEKQRPQTNDADSEPENFRLPARNLPPEWQLIERALIHRTGCPTDRAHEATAAAQTDDPHDARWVYFQLLRWLAYTQDDRYGDSIKYVGHFCAAKVEQRAACPDFYQPPAALPGNLGLDLDLARRALTDPDAARDVLEIAGLAAPDASIRDASIGIDEAPF